MPPRDLVAIEGLLFFALTARCRRAMRQKFNSAVAKACKRLHYPLDIILLCVRWCSAYPLSCWHPEETMAERGISVDHSTVHRWAIKLLPVLERCASGQVPEQHRRARLPRPIRRRTRIDARLQGFSLCPHPSLWHRTYAHDQQRTNESGGSGQTPAQLFYSVAA